MKSLGAFGLLVVVWMVGAGQPLAAAESAPTPALARVSAPLSVGVFCGATDLAAPRYREFAQELGTALAQRHWTLVYGGSKTGLMGAVAQGAKEAGGRVVGILPEFIQRWEVAYTAADELMIVTTMAERKLLLQTRSDVFVVLPGGIGTLDELADTLDLRNLGLHRKPLILVNQDGYYNALLAFLEHSIAEKFTKPEARRQFIVTTTLEETLAELARLDAGT